MRKKSRQRHGVVMLRCDSDTGSWRVVCAHGDRGGASAARNSDQLEPE
jgi:hypothetical protein